MKKRIVIIFILLLQITYFAKGQFNATNNLFEEGTLIYFSPDLTFYGKQNVYGFGIGIEPSINEKLSLNYKFAFNITNSKIFSLHGTPGTVVSPYFIGQAVTDSSNGYWFLAVITLLIPEGINIKFQPAGYNNISYAIYINPFGVDYAKRLPELPHTIYPSGEVGFKSRFIINKNIFLGAYGGARSIYRFGKVGFTFGINVGIALDS